MPHSNSAPQLFIGLISGTSADGIDAALVRFTGDGDATQCELAHGHTYPWPDELRARLIALGQGAPVGSLDEVGTLDVRIGEHFAAAALQLVEDAGTTAREVRAIGSHGQTVRHRPAGAAFDGNHPFTMQLGDAHVIAERSGRCTTRCCIRHRKIARCSIWAASPTSPCCLPKATCVASTRGPPMR
jgi:anhydro-N-acetylmuramic acid kinase